MAKATRSIAGSADTRSAHAWLDTAKLAATTPAKTNDDLTCLRPYVDAVENGPDTPVTFERPSTDEMQLHASFSPDRVCWYRRHGIRIGALPWPGNLSLSAKT